MSYGEQKEVLLNELGYRLILAVKSGKTTVSELNNLNNNILYLVSVLDREEKGEETPFFGKR